MVTSDTTRELAHGIIRSPLPGHVIHDVDGAGPIYAAVRAPGGRRYFSDEYHHRVLVQEPTGYHWSIGTYGQGPAEFRHPRGLAFLSADWAEECRLFVCDAWNHRVQVFDALGHFLFAFGAFGRGPAQFDVPSDVTLVWPQFAGEDLDPDASDAAFVAVADRWNNRIQLFGTDGSFVAALGAGNSQGTARPPAHGSWTGWPHFRFGLDPVTSFPVRLEWQPPELLVTSANGRELRIDLAAAMLPDFDTWQRAATPLELESAARDLLTVGGAPPEVAAAIRNELGRDRLRQGRAADAAREWAIGWPADLDPSLVERLLERRVEAIVTPNAPRRRPPVRLISALATRLNVEWRRRARREATSALMEERPRRLPDSPSANLSPAQPLLALRARLAGKPATWEPVAETVWKAPASEGDLQQIATNGTALALVAAREPAIWLFGLDGEPTGRFALPAGTTPRGIAPAPDGGWFVTDLQHRCILRFDAEGRLIERWCGRREEQSLGRPVAAGVAAPHLFVVDREADRVEVFSAAGDAVGGYPRLGAPSAVWVTSTELWIAGWQPSAIRVLSRESGEPLREFTHPDLISPCGLAHMAGTLLVADAYGTAVHAFDTTRGHWLGRAWRADFGPLGRLVGLAPTDGAVIAVDHDHAALVRVAPPDGDHPWRQQ